MPSIKSIISLLFTWGILTSGSAQPSGTPQGKWTCLYKSGQYDAETRYQLNCTGSIEFRTDGTIYSDCTEAFSPSGALWKTEGNQLYLQDSEGATFVTYTWHKPDHRTLTLEKKGVVFTFDRVLRN